MIHGIAEDHGASRDCGRRAAAEFQCAAGLRVDRGLLPTRRDVGGADDQRRSTELVAQHDAQALAAKRRTHDEAQRLVVEAAHRRRRGRTGRRDGRGRRERRGLRRRGGRDRGRLAPAGGGWLLCGGHDQRGGPRAHPMLRRAPALSQERQGRDRQGEENCREPVHKPSLKIDEALYLKSERATGEFCYEERARSRSAIFARSLAQTPRDVRIAPQHALQLGPGAVMLSFHRAGAVVAVLISGTPISTASIPAPRRPSSIPVPHATPVSKTGASRQGRG